MNKIELSREQTDGVVEEIKKYFAEEREETIKVVKFHGKKDDDFALWMLRMEAVLEVKELMGIVDGTEGSPEEDDEEALSAFNIKVRKARALLINSLGDRPLRAVQKAKRSPKGMWKKLHDRYATSSSASRIQVHMALHSKKLKPDEVMEDFIDGFESLFERLAAMDYEIEESMKVAMLLSSFDSSKDYDHVISALKTLSKKELIWDDISARLIEEYRTKKSGKKVTSVANGKNKARLMVAKAKKVKKSKNGNTEEKPPKLPTCYIFRGPHKYPDCPFGEQIRKMIESGKNKESESEKQKKSDKPVNPNLEWTALGARSYASPKDFFLDSGALII